MKFLKLCFFFFCTAQTCMANKFLPLENPKYLHEFGLGFLCCSCTLKKRSKCVFYSPFKLKEMKGKNRRWRRKQNKFFFWTFERQLTESFSLAFVPVNPQIKASFTPYTERFCYSGRSLCSMSPRSSTESGSFLKTFKLFQFKKKMEGENFQVLGIRREK